MLHLTNQETAVKHIAIVLALGLSAGSAMAQANPQDHAAHHPEGAASAPAAAVPAARPSAAAPDGFEQQMQKMQDMHKRMQAAGTPAEKQALMAEHMKLMQSGMEMMARMGQASAGGMGGMGSSGMPATVGSGAPGAAQGQGAGMQGMGGMMAMHGAMERRMAMMEQMMQMMVDREAAMPRR